ncbi:MAG: IS6 family transposase [Candidatus Bathyarchaeota archaeon]|nr:IS6 family transposase [Candidatus Bathyarchaeota archaeon]
MSRREIKALQIVAKKGIYEMGNGMFKVASQSKPSQYHVVRTIDGKRLCDCADFAKGKKCKHIYAATYYLMLKDLTLGISCNEENIDTCPNCNSRQIVKSGYRHNKSGLVQRYYCKSCKKSFRDPRGFKWSRYNPHIIATALDLYCRGLSLREVADHLKSTYKIAVSYGTIYMWIKRYVELVHKYTTSLTKRTYERWCADETVLRIKSRDLLLWTLLDYESRLLIAHRISTTKNTKEAASLIKKGLQSTSSPPLELVSDGNPAYSKALKNAIKPSTPIIHVVGPLAGPITNNRSERLNQTVKRRVRKAIHFNSKEGAESFMKAFEVFYNFIRPHQALENYTPAEKAGIMEKTSWHRLIKMAKSKGMRGNNNS